MSNVLTTFPGKFGDILWSLATVKELSRIVGKPVDFAMMPMYTSLIPLLKAQSYIDNAFVVNDWYLEHSNHGDQPWQPPKHLEERYEQFWHLGYRGHPGINAEAMSLIDFAAWQQGVSFKHSPIPFIDAVPHESVFVDVSKTPAVLDRNIKYIAYAFNEQYDQQKQTFFVRLQQALPDVLFVDVSKYPWAAASFTIAKAMGFVGCRSANWVLAHAVGKRIICFEPHPSRNQYGHLGRVFSCPYGEEYGLTYQAHVDQHVAAAANLIKSWKEE